MIDIFDDEELDDEARIEAEEEEEADHTLWKYLK